jgi:hypothetical protein
MSAKDISSKSSSMERNSAILYRNRRPTKGDPASYGGLLRMADGTYYWAFVWPRLVNGKAVVELRLTPPKLGA